VERLPAVQQRQRTAQIEPSTVIVEAR